MLVWTPAAWAATLAVLPFDNHTGQPERDALGLGVADMLVTDLASVPDLELVERERLKDVLAELALSRSDWADPKRAVEAGKGVGAQWMLVGTVTAVEPELRLDARLVEVASGKVLHTASAQGALDAFFDVEKDLAFGITEALGYRLSPRDAAKVGRVATESFDAFADWSAGLEALDRGAMEEARKRFEAALAHDSGFGAANAELSALQERLDASDAVREAVLDSQTAKLEELVVAYRKGTAGPGDVAAWVEAHTPGFNGMPAWDRIHVFETLIGLDVPESTKVKGDISVPEQALAFGIFAANEARDAARVLAWSETYLERYPAGRFYDMIRKVVDFIVGLQKQAAKARQDGTLERLQRTAEGKTLDTRCMREPDRRRVGDRCRAFLAHLLASPDPKAEVVMRVLRRLMDVPDRASIEATIPRLAKLGATSEQVHTWEKNAERLREQEGLRVERRAGIEQQLAAGEPIRAYALEELIRWGHLDDAAELLARARKGPTPADRLEDVQWALHRERAEVDALRGMLEQARGTPDPFRNTNQLAGELAEVERALVDIGPQAEGQALKDLAWDLGVAGLARERAETWDRMLTEELFPEHFARPAVLMQTAYAWSALYEPAGQTRAFELVSELVEKYPDSPQVQSADLLRKTLNPAP